VAGQIAHVVAQAKGAVEICECPASLGLLKRRPGVLHWRVPDANFPGKWYDAFDEVVAARTNKGLSRQGFSRRGLIRSMFCSSLPDGSIKELVNGVAGQADESTRALGIEKCIRILPHDNDSGAFFVTLLRKKAPVTFALPLDPEAAAEAEAATNKAIGAQAPASLPSLPSPSSTPADVFPVAGASGGQGEAPLGEAGGNELPKEFVDHCTRLTRMEARVLKVEPYVPLQHMPNGHAAWQSISLFYGVSPAFPWSQLLAHSQRLKVPAHHSLLCLCLPPARALCLSISVSCSVLVKCTLSFAFVSLSFGVSLSHELAFSLPLSLLLLLFLSLSLPLFPAPLSPLPLSHIRSKVYVKIGETKNCMR